MTDRRRVWVLRIAALSLVLLAIVPAAAAPATGDSTARETGVGSSSGPALVITECTIEPGGCGLDPNTPDLIPSACTSTLAELFERRGIRTVRPGGVGDVCAIDPNALVVLATIRAACPVERGRKLARPYVARSRLHADVEIRDCATGKVVGRGSAGRAIEWGRRRTLSDAVEELSHHISIRDIRATHPETPMRWMRSDVGGQMTIDISGGVLDVKKSDMNGFFKSAGIPTDDLATRQTAQVVIHSWKNQRSTVVGGIDAMQVATSGHGTFDSSDLSLRPPSSFTSARVTAKLRTVGAFVDWGYGYDLTRHQRVSIDAFFGYYILGTWLAPSAIEVEGAHPGSLNLADSQYGVGANARWDWRLTPHFGVHAGYGWTRLAFRSTMNTLTGRFLPADIDFTGQTVRVGFGFTY